MAGIEAAGDIVTGALLGRAVEPDAGEGGGHGAQCLNCATALVGTHCHKCGQAAHVHRSLHSMGHDLLHGVFHFEGKLWRTLPLLAWRPGRLMRRYIDGERARFVSPIALFLFSIFALFAVFSMFDLAPHINLQAEPMTAAQVTQLKQNLAKARAKIAAQKADLAPGDPEAAEIDKRLAQIDQSISKAAVGRVVNGPIDDEVKINTGWSRLDEGIHNTIDNPSLALYKAQSDSYKFSWLLILLSLPFVWLLFAWRREFPLYDHAVFVTLSISWMSLLFIALTVLGAMGVPFVLLAVGAVLLIPAHLYLELRDGYALGRFAAVARTILLLFFSAIVLTIFAVIMLAMGVLG